MRAAMLRGGDQSQGEVTPGATSREPAPPTTRRRVEAVCWTASMRSLDDSDEGIRIGGRRGVGADDSVGSFDGGGDASGVTHVVLFGHDSVGKGREAS